GNNVTKLEWAKVLMISHCLPIRNALSFKGKTILGNDLPHFVDLPLEHTNDETHDWYVDTIYTAAYYEIIGSPTAQWANANSFITVSEGIKMAIKTFEVLNDRPARTADSNVRPLINDEKWYFTYYSKAIAENIFSYLAQSPDRAETLLKRNEALYYLLDSMLRDNLYTMEDGSDIRDYFQKTFIGGKREPVTIGGEVLGVSTQDHLLLAKIGEYQLALEQERQRATIYVWASILLAGAAFFAGKGLKKKKEHRK
ncbi:MAG TPA: hypothetical protein VI588_02385, partial [Candidatus Gracilibacteria bacterium]|nr:hypothetical protein [Candidatus Gracilibacteria bacterium]